MSDSESSGSVVENAKFNLDVRDLVRVEEGERQHEGIKYKFLSCSEHKSSKVEVVAIYRNSFSSLTGNARLQSFRLFTKAMEMKRGGNSNNRCAWHAVPKYSIGQIISHGFCRLQENVDRGLYGFGVYLSPDCSAIESVNDMAEDEDGLKHIFLCRVILGKSELVLPGSLQCHPSTEDTDSGVDDLVCPEKYIIWSTNKNTHILPLYLLSLRDSSSSSSPEGPINTQMAVNKLPTSPWIPFTRLISALSVFLPEHTMKLVYKFEKDHQEKKISRGEMVRRLRMITGDGLLAFIINVFNSKCRQQLEKEQMQIKIPK